MAWRVARSLDILLGQLNRRFPQRSKVSDGSIGDAAHATRDSDHNPWYGPGIVTARDYTHDPAHGLDIGRLSDELAASRDRRIKYVIANGWILDSRAGHNPWKWVRYSGSNPHTAHLHLSVMDNPSCDDTTPWNLPMLGGTPAPEDDMQPDERAALFAIQNELLGPRGPQGQIQGWGTTLGPRTVVAMLVDLVNAAYAPIPSSVDGSDYAAPPRQYLANVDAYGHTNVQKLTALHAAFTELADAYAADRDIDPEQIKSAVREALQESTVRVDIDVTGPENRVEAERADLAAEDG